MEQLTIRETLTKKMKNKSFLFLNLMLYKISPFGNILTYMFGARILWNLPIFSFLKNVSGIHTFFASVIVRYLILSEISNFTNKN